MTFGQCELCPPEHYTIGLASTSCQSCGTGLACSNGLPYPAPGWFVWIDEHNGTSPATAETARCQEGACAGGVYGTGSIVTKCGDNRQDNGYTNLLCDLCEGEGLEAGFRDRYEQVNGACISAFCRCLFVSLFELNVAVAFLAL